MKEIGLIALLIFSLSVVKAQDIAGVWNVNWSKTISKAKISEIQKYEAMADEIRGNTMTSMQSRQYEFSGAVVNISWKGLSGERSSQGTFTWNKETNIVTLIMQSKSRAYQVSFVDSNTMEWTIVNPDDTILFSQIVLIR